MKPSVLQFIRNASDETMIGIVLDLASKHEDLFIELAVERGLEEATGFHFPHGYEVIPVKLLLEIKQCCAVGNKIAAIKAYRQARTSDLRTAKDAVEYLIETGITPIGPRPEPNYNW